MDPIEAIQQVIDTLIEMAERGEPVARELDEARHIEGILQDEMDRLADEAADAHARMS